ncbi:PPE family protein [Mycobacterium sp. 050134]|uniref:PPE family protein n=1 Tax=Mycobacterium sp. 050134 TaxID=3096111 RepID=UPI002EDB82BB
MDFGMMPPEITSALIHSGPGAGSLVEAAGVWLALAIDVEDTLPRYAAELWSLGEAWRGPSAAAMGQAVEPYLAWLRATAQQCEQVGASLQAAAAAFEAARGSIALPAEVAANRARLAQLLATNWLGTNLVPIAETEAQYEGMWVRNSAAMYRYEAASAQALDLPQFSSPPAIVNPAMAAAQTTATAAQAAAAPAQTPLGELLTSLLSTPLGFNPQKGWFGLLNAYANQFIAGGIPINLLSYLAQLGSSQTLQNVGSDIVQGLGEGESALGAVASGLTGAARAIGSAPTAATGVGVLVGKLMMPPSVVGVVPGPQVQLASAVSPLPTSEFGLPEIQMPPFRMPPMSAAKRKREGRDYDDIELGLELKGTVMHRPPSAG